MDQIGSPSIVFLVNNKALCRFIWPASNAFRTSIFLVYMHQISPSLSLHKTWSKKTYPLSLSLSLSFINLRLKSKLFFVLKEKKEYIKNLIFLSLIGYCSLSSLHKHIKRKKQKRTHSYRNTLQNVNAVYKIPSDRYFCITFPSVSL